MKDTLGKWILQPGTMQMLSTVDDRNAQQLLCHINEWSQTDEQQFTEAERSLNSCTGIQGGVNANNWTMLGMLATRYNLQNWDLNGGDRLRAVDFTTGKGL